MNNIWKISISFCFHGDITEKARVCFYALYSSNIYQKFLLAKGIFFGHL